LERRRQLRGRKRNEGMNIVLNKKMNFTAPPKNTTYSETKKKAIAFRKKNKPVMSSGGKMDYKGYTKF
jgi:hypothetical protein